MNLNVFALKGSKSRGYLSTGLLVAACVALVFSRICVGAFGKVSSTAKRAALVSTLRELQTAADAFYLGTSTWPSASQDIQYALLDFCANDTENNTFCPCYVRWRPSIRAGDYGFASADTLVFGITRNGRVFATVQSPQTNLGWTESPGTVYTCYDPSGVEADVLVDITAPAAPATILCECTKVRAETTESVGVTATAYDQHGFAAANARLCFVILGSVSGPEQRWATTNEHGVARIYVQSDNPEIVRVVVTTE